MAPLNPDNNGNSKALSQLLTAHALLKLVAHLQIEHRLSTVSSTDLFEELSKTSNPDLAHIDRLLQRLEDIGEVELDLILHERGFPFQVVTITEKGQRTLQRHQP